MGGLFGPKAPLPAAINIHFAKISVSLEVIILNISFISNIFLLFDSKLWRA